MSAGGGADAAESGADAIDSAAIAAPVGFGGGGSMDSGIAFMNCLMMRFSGRSSMLYALRKVRRISSC
jgi:hypothetical protein